MLNAQNIIWFRFCRLEFMLNAQNIIWVRSQTITIYKIVQTGELNNSLRNLFARQPSYVISVALLKHIEAET